MIQSSSHVRFHEIVIQGNNFDQALQSCNFDLQDKNI